MLGITEILKDVNESLLSQYAGHCCYCREKEQHSFLLFKNCIVFTNSRMPLPFAVMSEKIQAETCALWAAAIGKNEQAKCIYKTLRQQKKIGPYHTYLWFFRRQTAWFRICIKDKVRWMSLDYVWLLYHLKYDSWWVERLLHFFFKTENLPHCSSLRKNLAFCSLFRNEAVQYEEVLLVAAWSSWVQFNFFLKQSYWVLTLCCDHFPKRIFVAFLLFLL